MTGPGCNLKLGLSVSNRKGSPDILLGGGAYVCIGGYICVGEGTCVCVYTCV